MAGLLCGLLGVAALGLAFVIRRGRHAWARRAVARPRGTGPQDVLLLLPAAGLLLVGVALLEPARTHASASIVSGVLILLGAAGGLWAVLGRLPRWIHPRWYEPRIRSRVGRDGRGAR